jgi:hypothetical protein
MLRSETPTALSDRWWLREARALNVDALPRCVESQPIVKGEKHYYGHGTRIPLSISAQSLVLRVVCPT